MFQKTFLQLFSPYRLDESTQDNKTVLRISHAEHVRLIAVVNEEHKIESPQKRRSE